MTMPLGKHMQATRNKRSNCRVDTNLSSANATVLTGSTHTQSRDNSHAATIHFPKLPSRCRCTSGAIQLRQFKPDQRTFAYTDHRRFHPQTQDPREAGQQVAGGTNHVTIEPVSNMRTTDTNTRRRFAPETCDTTTPVNSKLPAHSVQTSSNLFSSLRSR